MKILCRNATVLSPNFLCLLRLSKRKQLNIGTWNRTRLMTLTLVLMSLFSFQVANAQGGGAGGGGGGGGGASGDLICKGCVDASDIAKSAVTNSKIKKGAVSNSKLGLRAVSTSKLASGAVTSSKIQDGAVTVNKVSPELSNAIGTYCPAGESVVGMDASGNLVCESKLAQVLDTDLTGKIYCYINPFSELLVDVGNSAKVTTGLGAGRLDFTSPTQFTHTELVDSTSAINLPVNTMVVSEYVDAAEMGTYSFIGNRLALTFDDDGGSFTIDVMLTPDGQVFIFSAFSREDDGSIYDAESGILIGVQADSCD